MHEGLDQVLLTDVVGVEILAEIGESRPCEYEKVNFGNKFALLRASVETVPDNAPDFLS